PVDERRLRRDLAEVRGEVAVPEERHALAERRLRREHVVDPPLLQLRDRKALVHVRLVAARERWRLLDRRREEPVDGLRVALALRLLQLRLRRAEGEAPQQLRD